MDLRNREFLQKLELRVEKDYTAFCGKTDKNLCECVRVQCLFKSGSKS